VTHSLLIRDRLSHGWRCCYFRHELRHRTPSRGRAAYSPWWYPKSPIIAHKRALYFHTNEPYIFTQMSPILPKRSTMFLPKNPIFPSWTASMCTIARARCVLFLMVSKEPYVSAYKSSVFSKRSPIFLQKKFYVSVMNCFNAHHCKSALRNLPDRTTTSPIFPHKRAVYFRKGALYFCQKKTCFSHELPQCAPSRGRAVYSSWWY